MKVALRKVLLGRWIVTNAEDPLLGWSGSHWVPIDYYGFPAGSFQVSNFDTEDEAATYAATFGFDVTN